MTDWVARATIVPRFLDEIGFADADALVTKNEDLLARARSLIGSASPAERLRFRAVLERLTVLDPTCGSGAFLLAALRVLAALDRACLGDERAPVLEGIVRRSIFGVDIDPDAVLVCRLRLLLEVAAERDPASVEPLPDLSASVRCADALHVALEERFEVVIGNPPYVECEPSGFARFKTAASGNLYALVLERSLELLAPGGRWGFVVPLSLTFSEYLDSTRRLVEESAARLWYASFDNIPDRLFPGGKESTNTSRANQQRITVVLARGCTGAREAPRRFATALLRWRASERTRLFGELPWAEVTSLPSVRGWPKVSGAGARLLEAVAGWGRLGEHLAARPRKARHRLVVPKTAAYYVAAYEDEKARSKQMIFGFDDAEDAAIARVLLNSNFFFWWFRVFGDAFDVTRWLVESCPWPRPARPGAGAIAERLHAATEECTVHKGYRGVAVPNVNYNQRMDLLHECDEWVLAHLPEEARPEWGELLRYKSTSWFSFEIAKAGSWPGAGVPVSPFSERRPTRP